VRQFHAGLFLTSTQLCGLFYPKQLLHEFKEPSFMQRLLNKTVGEMDWITQDENRRKLDEALGIFEKQALKPNYSLRLPSWAKSDKPSLRLGGTTIYLRYLTNFRDDLEMN
jgi:hypothetical protein